MLSVTDVLWLKQYFMTNPTHQPSDWLTSLGVLYQSWDWQGLLVLCGWNTVYWPLHPVGAVEQDLSLSWPDGVKGPWARLQFNVYVGSCSC